MTGGERSRSGVELALIKLTQRIREEFEEAPGLRLSAAEAARFWSLDERTCERVLARLLSAGFLDKDFDERYGEAQSIESRWSDYAAQDA